ncbi:MAG: aminotransferase class I/II-fold pyridoxal phosphate-dependent enzyme [Chthoniobacterales bacterium]
MIFPFQERLASKLALIKKKNLWRSPACIERALGTHLRIDGQDYCHFSSNDYLGLSSHPALQEAALAAGHSFGYGATASRLICGNTKEHQLLEEELAATKQTEAALLFSSGFAAALGAISSLMERGSVIILDKLVHASLIDGARASKAVIRIFRHGDMTHLEDHLRWARHTFPSGDILIITESVFSMDGDVAPLHEMVALKEYYGALLFVDEAHAIGVRGKPDYRMGGLVGELGLTERVDIQMGTLSKAVGASGGYLCASRTIIDYLLHHARIFIYTTAAPPSVIAAARAGVRIINSSEGELLALQLWKNIRQLSANDQYGISGLVQQEPASAIMPFMLGTEEKALAASSLLREAGYFVPAIRYPTVARNKARLRITMTAQHTEEEIALFAQKLYPFTETNKKIEV